MDDEATVVTFGPYKLYPRQRRLLAGCIPVPLSSRAIEILILLVERAGQVVGRDELVARAWPGLFVDDSNLRVHIAALRKALGERRGEHRYIVNVPNRGYSFIEPVVNGEPEAAATQPVRVNSLPARLAPVIGRERCVAEIASAVQSYRFVTVTGPGGIGKTTVAIAVAEELANAYEHGVSFVDLGALTNPEQVAVTVAAGLGVSPGFGDAQAALLAFVRERHLLVLLDCCEPVIHAAAQLIELMLKTASRLHVLTTSREPLRAEGERSYRLPPMENAPANSRFTAEAAQDFSAVRLFVERATASQSEFVLKDQDVPMLTEICRRLDGIPLAIELAAAQVAALGIRGLSERLSSRFSLLLRGRRTALPRHQTLLATLDWSYDLLPDNERTVLRRVAIFSGAFTTDAVSAVAENHVTLLDAVGCVASLISKSLIVAEVSDVAGYLRLHDTTRTYALNKLAQSGEYEQVARRHAEFFCAFVKRSEAEWDIRPIADWRGVYRRQIDNLRTAMDWAASPTGDSSIALALTVASVPLWVEFSLIAECRRRVEQALERLGSGSSQGTRHEMQLYAALGLSLMFTTGAAPETCTALTKALAIAESINDRDYQLRLLWGLWADRLNNRDFVATLARAKQFRELATTDAGPADVAIGDRLIGFSLHFLGDQSGAREHTERMLKNHVPVAQGSHVVRFQFDQPTVARVGLARILWLQGFPEQGLRMAKDAIDHAVSLGHVLSLCNALIQAGCPLSLLAGDLAAASRYLAALRLHTEGHGLDVWRTCGNCFEGQLRILSGELNDGPRLLAMAIEELSTAGYVQYQSVFLATLADGAARAGRVAEGMAAINRAVALSAAAEEGWCMAELLRGKGELLLLEALPNAATAAEEHFLKAMDLARQQGALSWELRAATSLVRLRRDQGDVGAAGHLLSSVYQRFTEGFETADLRAAKVFLDAMA